MREEDSSKNVVSNGFSASTNGSTPKKGSISLNRHSSMNGSTPTYANGASKKHAIRSPYYRGHDREELTRILIQGLKDMGYDQAASSLVSESGYQLENADVASFRRAILEGQWTAAEDILIGSQIGRGLDVDPGGGLILAEGANRNQMLFWIRQQKFLELLFARELLPALRVLREELTPLNHDTHQLHALSSLLMCTQQDLESQLKWPEDPEESRRLLLQDLTRSIAPSVMIRDHRLAELLDQVKEAQINQCLYHNTSIPPSLYSDHVCNRDDFPSRTWMILEDHSGEVYYVQFSPDGTKLATAGEDKVCIIYDTASFRVLHKLKEHTATITHLAWSPDSKKLITTARDSRARVWDVSTGKTMMTIDHNNSENRAITGSAWTPDSASFVTCCHDPASRMCLWSLHGTDPQKPVHTWSGDFRVPDVVITPDGKRLFIQTTCNLANYKREVCNDLHETLYVYDLQSYREEYRYKFSSIITSITISRDSRTALLNLSEGEVDLIDIDQRYIIRKFKGQKQGSSIIRSCFGGAAENFVLSGSEDGRIYIWHKENAALIETLRGHNKGQKNQECVTTVSWNPKDAGMFASGGDDRKVRIWTNASDDTLAFEPRIRHPDLERTSAVRSTSNL